MLLLRASCLAALLVLLTSAPSSAQAALINLDVTGNLDIAPKWDLGVPTELKGWVDLNNVPASTARFPTVVDKMKLAAVTDALAPIVVGTDPTKIAMPGLGTVVLPFPFPKPWWLWGLYYGNVGNNWSAWQKICAKVGQAPVDVLFLADNTGSMSSYINAVKAAASSMYTSMSAGMTNLQIGVSAYKDVGDTFVYKNFKPIGATTAATFTTAINNWAASGGGDWPEAQLYALSQAASSAATGWRASSVKIIVWFGDAPGHDPSVGVSLAAAQAALAAKGIKVIALDCSYLNSPSPTPQASTIASASGGMYGTVTASNIAATMISSLANIVVNIKPVVTCPTNTPIIIEVSPTTTTATPTKPGCFSVRVKACNSTSCSKPGLYTCSVAMVDMATGNTISTYPIFVSTAPGIDTLPPTFAPSIPPVSIVLECPSYYKCPTLTAVDNCDGNWTVAPGVVTTGNTCKRTTTCTWKTKDAAGNYATAVQTAIVQDTQPPMISATCAYGAWCFWRTSSPPCLSKKDLVSKCFRDKCNGVLKYTVTCNDCKTMTPPVAMECKDDGADKICFYWTSAISPNIPSCCFVTVTVTDSCGNATTQVIRVCYVPPGVTSPYACINGATTTTGGGLTPVPTP